jgi:hypothetical protein
VSVVLFIYFPCSHFYFPFFLHQYAPGWLCIFGSNNRKSSHNKRVEFIRVWAWFSVQCAGEIALLDDGSDITELVDNYLVSKAAALFGINPLSFVDDNGCALTTSSFVCFKKLYSNINIQEIKWPCKSSHISRSSLYYNE